MGVLYRCPNTTRGRGVSGGGEKFPAGTNIFQVEGTVPNLSRTYCVAGTGPGHEHTFHFILITIKGYIIPTI